MVHQTQICVKLVQNVLQPLLYNNTTINTTRLFRITNSGFDILDFVIYVQAILSFHQLLLVRGSLNAQKTLFSFPFLLSLFFLPFLLPLF